VKKQTTRSTRLCTLLVMLGLLTALLLSATAQALAAAKPPVDFADIGQDRLFSTGLRAGALSPYIGGSPAERAASAGSEAVVPLGGPPSESRGSPVVSPPMAEPPTESWHTLLASLDGHAYYGARIYSREESDQSWTRLGEQTLPSPVRQIAWHPHGAHIYALVGGGGDLILGAKTLYRSTDWGTTWTQVTSIADIYAFAIHPQDPAVLYAGKAGDASTRGLWRSTDSGQTWQHISTVLGWIPRSMGISPVDPDLMFAGVHEGKGAESDERIFRSTDGGFSWTSVYWIHGGGSIGYVASPTYVLPDRFDSSRAYIALHWGDDDAGVLITTDKGQSWRLETGFGSNAQRDTYTIAQSATNANVLYKIGVTLNNIWKSTDRGDTWSQIVTGIDETNGFNPNWMLTSNRDPDLLYVGGSKPCDGYNCYVSWVYKSTDAGAHWTNYQIGLPGYRTTVRSMLLLETEGASHYFGLGYCHTGQCGDPVNTSTGNFAHQEQDLSIPGPGASLSVQRTYNSQDSYEGPLGEGWSLNYDMRLTSMETKVVEMKVEDGRRDRYVSSDGEEFVPPPGVNAAFVRNADSTYTLTREDQTRYNFGDDGFLTSIVTSNELTTTLTYSGTRLTNVTEPGGRTITFTWNITDSRITGIEDPLGRSVVYTYTSGDLTGVSDLRGNVAAYFYTGTNGLLSSLVEGGRFTPPPLQYQRNLWR